MAEIITCPACGRKLQVPESFYGQLVQCPECTHQFVADPHAQSLQTTPPSAPSAAPLPRDDRDERDLDERPRRRRRAYDDDYDDDDDFGDMRRPRRYNAPHRGGTILAIGIISLVIFPYSTLICGPLAWVMGNSDLAEIRAGRMDPGGEGMVQAGRVLGMISTFLLLAVVAFFCLIFGMFAIADMH
jgi:hypothetical protein